MFVLNCSAFTDWGYNDAKLFWIEPHSESSNSGPKTSISDTFPIKPQKSAKQYLALCAAPLCGKNNINTTYLKVLFMSGLSAQLSTHVWDMSNHAFGDLQVKYELMKGNIGYRSGRATTSSAQNRMVCPISCVVCMWACCHSPINVDWIQVQVCPSKCYRAESIPIHPPNLFMLATKLLNYSMLSFIPKRCQNSQCRHSAVLTYLYRTLCVLRCP